MMDSDLREIEIETAMKVAIGTAWMNGRAEAFREAAEEARRLGADNLASDLEERALESGVSA